MRANFPTNRRHPNDRIERMTAINTPLSKMIRQVFEKRGFLDGKIIQNWPLIAGKMLASLSLPERISFPRGKELEM